MVELIANDNLERVNELFPEPEGCGECDYMIQGSDGYENQCGRLEKKFYLWRGYKNVNPKKVKTCECGKTRTQFERKGIFVHSCKYIYSEHRNYVLELIKANLADEFDLDEIWNRIVELIKLSEMAINMIPTGTRRNEATETVIKSTDMLPDEWQKKLIIDKE